MQLARRNLLKGGLLCSTAAVAAVAVTPASAKLVENAISLVSKCFNGNNLVALCRLRAA